MGTGKLWLKVPPTLRFVFHGRMPPYLMAKDLILHVIGEIGVDGATYCAMEFAGEAVAALNMDERMTLCNMAIEAGGKNGIIAADAGHAGLRPRADRQALSAVYQSDPDATYAEGVRVRRLADWSRRSPSRTRPTAAPPPGS